MRISDWSSDVCSSDLPTAAERIDERLEELAQSALRQERGDWAAGERGPATDGAPAGRRRRRTDRKSVVSGKSVSVRVDLGGRRIIKKNTHARLKHQRTIQTPPLNTTQNKNNI